MIDFMKVATRHKNSKSDVVEIYPKFLMVKSEDLMIRGGDFYAIWMEEKGLWSTDELDALYLIDKELDEYAEENKQKFESGYKVLHMWDAESGQIDKWHKYCQKQCRDSFHMLDEKLIFSNDETRKEDYASKRLKYPLEKGDMQAYEKLMSVLYSPEEKHKIEWAIGAVVSGDSKTIQKFLVLYGSAGTGKSTVLNIIQQLFEGYYAVFDAKALGSSNNSFALEAFKSNPLVAVQHDGDLSRIEDNTRLNSLVSHEIMTVNEKFKSTYSNRFKCFLFMGTNKPVKITDAKSGLIRRLIDVSPTGDRVSQSEYNSLTKQIGFELGAIAYHCLDVYKEDPNYYDDYIPINMLGASNDFYNFVIDSYQVFKEENGTTLKAAWEMYKTYCDEAKVGYPLPQRIFKEELKSYFKDYKERYSLDDGTRVRSYYIGFRKDKFEDSSNEKNDKPKLLKLNCKKSLFDKEYADCPAQYANAEGKPTISWSEVTTTLSDIDTSKTHYIRVPKDHIVIDFDIRDEDDKKSLEKNLEEASKWPPTYAELSQGGSGVHLHYIYTGDTSELSRVYDDHIEIKVPVGRSSLRRKLTKCNNLPIAKLNGGLPLKGEKKKMTDFNTIKSEKGLRNMITRNLNKEFHANTKPSMDFIYKILDDAYNSGMRYDVSDMEPAIFSFAAGSTNNSEYCIKLMNKMKFCSEDQEEKRGINEDKKIIFYDIEVFPNLFLVNWKLEGDDKKVVRMINPSSEEIEKLLDYRLIGFNCRRYDNHILYARLMGYNNEQLYELSQKIISGKRNCFFGEAYNLSYTDVYDFSSKKQSLKKFEIDLGIHHQELGIPWDQPVPKDMQIKVSEYCDNDVIATEAVFNNRKADFTAREILADLAEMTVNDTTNSLTTRIIFGNNRTPQDQFNYRNLGGEKNEPYKGDQWGTWDKKGRPVFPGYIFESGKSTYRDEEVGEGGYVYAEPGMYGNVALLDIASMHPSSIVDENLFGDKYTARFKDILDARIAIKHGDFDSAKKMLDGKLAKYLTDEKSAADLAGALKIAINSVYGLTAAKFENPFKDPRNKDNIVAKRGALFMVNLKHEIQKRGFRVAHIKTDSIKIPDATPEIIDFVFEYGKKYGYIFEHQATYEKMCLVNNAVYIAKTATPEQCEKLYGSDYIYSNSETLEDCKKHPGEWTATGTQFAVPYVFKTLFSKEDIVFDDLCETRSVTTDLYLDMNEDLLDTSEYEKDFSKAESDYKHGLLSDTTFEKKCQELTDIISKGHNYRYIGKVGLFCPIKSGCGGGLLMRRKDNKYYAVTGTTGYRWMESEMVKTLGKEKNIDRSYYDHLVNDAVDSISQYGDFEWFVSDDPYISKPADDFMNIPIDADEEIPFN